MSVSRPFCTFIISGVAILMVSGMLSAQTTPASPLPNVQVSGVSGAYPYLYPGNVVVNPTDAKQILAGAADNTCPRIGAAYSTPDGGTTWTRVCLRGIQNLDSVGALSLAYANDGSVYAALGGSNGEESSSYVAITHSDDNGITWSRAQSAVPHIYGYGDIGTSTLAIDNSPNSPFANALYISAYQYSLSNYGRAITVSRSSNGGATWKTQIVAHLPESIYTDGQGFNHLAIAKDGTVYVSWMPCATPCPSTDIMVTKSADGGQTWTSPAPIAHVAFPPDNLLPNTSHHIWDNLPVIAVDNSAGPFAGRVYVSMMNWTGSFLQVVVANSADKGSTWSVPVLVAPGTQNHDQFYPWISVNPNGLVGVTWLDRRTDPGNVKYRTFAGFSKNGGESFGMNLRIAQAESDPNATFFYGGFAANVWAGKTLYSIWEDTRTGTVQDEFGGVAF